MRPSLPGLGTGYPPFVGTPQLIRALSVTGEGSRPLKTNTREAMQDLRLEEMTGAMEALWFTGISGKKTDNGFCFCISTAYEGHYLDSYYIQVDHLERPRLTRHCVPPFIPLGEIAKTHLQSDLKKFLSVLFDHLNGFAGRKFQADQLQDAADTHVADTLQRNSLHTVLSFSYNVKMGQKNFRFSAKLLYGDITGVLPTEALVTCPDNAGSVQEAAASQASLFRREPLHRAVKSLNA
ncbi:centromere protein O isoform X2 [Rhinoderma darwinii]|uniref:centromere protein O isoform X2 n=1 Tax=Rhinoderma darwinii TaxID=43563 RepID=UPI003F6807A3